MFRDLVMSDTGPLNSSLKMVVSSQLLLNMTLLFTALRDSMLRILTITN